MNYIELAGDYAIAYQDCLDKGGQLYPGNGKDSAVVIVRGRNCITYWQKGSKRHREVKDFCQQLGLDSSSQTGGRIARFLIEEELNLPYKSTYWSRQYRDLAKWGQHWHYQYVKPFEENYCIEVDLKSAYFSSLLKGKSLLYQPGIGYLDDGGALEYLRVLVPYFPKWFRLQLLGVLASWRMSFLCRDKLNKEALELTQKYYYKITYNAAFNAVHRAILRNYKILEKIHQMGGDYIKRIHTDSFFLSVDCPQEVEQKIFNYLEEKGCEFGLKGSGFSFFFDLNTGFIGKKFVGSKIDVIERIRSTGVKVKREGGIQKVVDRFGNLFELNPQQQEVTTLVANLAQKTPKQLTLKSQFQRQGIYLP